MPRLTIALLCGAMTALCLPRPGISPLAWAALAPLIGLWSSRAPKAAGLLGLAAGFGFHGTALYWIFNTCRFAGLSIPIALLAWVSLCSFLALNWALIAALGRWLTQDKPRALTPWIWAAVWTAITALSCFTPRLNIDILGYTQYSSLSLIQLGAILGPHALGFMIVAFNASLSQAWEDLEARGKAPALNLALVLALLCAGWGWGKYELLKRSPSKETVRVEILQPAIDQYQKWSADFEEAIQLNFNELLSGPRDKNPGIIVWPESSLTRVIEEGGALPGAASWSKKLGAFQLIGAVSSRLGLLRNSAILVSPDGESAGIYHKRELVPFGEFVPFDWLKAYIGILNELGGISAGDARQPLLDTPLGLASVTVCYEALFPPWSRLDASRGARVIFNITNDGWYKDTWGPYQHFGSNIYRAIENRATVIRSGNTGISAVIDPWGVIIGHLDLNIRGRLEVDVPKENAFPRGSFYSRYGDWFGLLCSLLTAALILLRLTRRAA